MGKAALFSNPPDRGTTGRMTIPRRLSRRRFLNLTVGASGLIVLSACGDSDDDAEPTLELPEPATPTNTPTPTTTPTPEPTPTETPEPTPTREHYEDPVVLECNDMLAPVNKTHRLPEDCAPQNLVVLPAWASHNAEQRLTEESAAALLRMFTEAGEQGHEIMTRSTYRSYQTQVWTYQSHVDRIGREAADRISARPGHSEHQLGTTADITTPQVNYQLTTDLANTSAGQWAAEHAWAHGFVMSYPEGTEHITGYSFEPWHFRYVGVDVARDVRSRGITLHEYLLERYG